MVETVPGAHKDMRGSTVDELTPEKIEAIYKWLETEPGQRYTEHSKKISELVEQQKKIINELLESV